MRGKKGAVTQSLNEILLAKVGYCCCKRASMASINIPVIDTGNSASISRIQVGLVTLISVRRSPIISRPTKISPFSFSVGPI